MKDELKNFVDNNRDAFEVHSIDKDALWIKISLKLKTSGNTRFKKIHFLQIAASIIFLISVTLFFAKIWQDKNENSTALAKNIYPDLTQAEKYYSPLIDQKIKFLKTKYPELSKDVQNNISVLDVEYKELKEDLKDNVSNADVIEAMVENYKLKLNILEEMLKQIEENETHEKEHTNL